MKSVDITEYISPSGEILYPKLLKDEVNHNYDRRYHNFDNNCDHCNNHDHNYDDICVDIFQLPHCHHRCYAVMQTSLLLQRRQPPLEVIIIINMNFCDDKNTFAGTTLILAILDEGQLWVANVGDSRGVFGNR